MSDLTSDEARLLEPYLTNLERPVFALRNLPEVVKGALFSRYSRTEKSLRRVLLDEFVNAPELGLAGASAQPAAGAVATQRAEEFYDRVLVGYGDDSVAELASAHLAVEQVSMLAAKALEDSRIGISPLEKSTRYVRFDRPGADGRFLYYRSDELGQPSYERACDQLFNVYSAAVTPLTDAVRERYPIEPDESERAWKAATRAKALDLLRGLLPAAALTNLGLFGNGRAFEYLLTKLSANDLPECRRLAGEMHRELSAVIPSFVKRALDERYGAPAAARLRAASSALRDVSPIGGGAAAGPSVQLIEYDPDAERRVAAAAVFPHSDDPLTELAAEIDDVDRVLAATVGTRDNRRQKVPRAFEQATYTFEIVGNFGAYRDLHRHRMLSQDRQLLGTSLGFDTPPELAEFGFSNEFVAAVSSAADAHHELEAALGPALAQYVVPMAYRLRWYFRANLREVFHLCELRTQVQGHSDYRWLAQQMFLRVHEVHPRLARFASFVDMTGGDELARRQSEKRLDAKLNALGNR